MGYSYTLAFALGLFWNTTRPQQKKAKTGLTTIVSCAGPGLDGSEINHFREAQLNMTAYSGFWHRVVNGLAKLKQRHQNLFVIFWTSSCDSSTLHEDNILLITFPSTANYQFSFAVTHSLNKQGIGAQQLVLWKVLTRRLIINESRPDESVDLLSLLNKKLPDNGIGGWMIKVKGRKG